MALSMKNSFEAEALPEQPVNHYPDLPEPTGEKIMIEWGDGWIKAGAVEYKKWKPVARRHKKGYETATAPWEYFIQCVIGLSNSHVLFREYPCQRDRYKYYSKMLGIRPTKFVDMWNCCNAKAFIPEDVRDLANKFCRGAFGHYDTQKIANLIKYKENIFQMIDDGQYNVVPFIVNTTRFYMQPEGKEGYYITPSNASELRKVLGKSAWKKVCKNSVSRNNKIAHLSNNLYYSGDSVWKDCTSLPTGLIPSERGQRVPSEEDITLLTNLRMISKPRREKRHVLTTVRDAKEMSSRLGYRLPKGHTKWKFNQWEEYHEQMVELTNKKKYSDAKFEWVQPIKNEYTSPCGNYTAHVLDSLYDIAMEGKAMKHCVAGYGNRVKDQKYLVISIRDQKGKRYSTLGCNVKEPTIVTQELRGFGEVTFAPEGNHRKLTFSQHYMACNKRIADKKVEMFASKIIEDINFKLKYMKQEK